MPFFLSLHTSSSHPINHQQSLRRLRCPHSADLHSLAWGGRGSSPSPLSLGPASFLHPPTPFLHLFTFPNPRRVELQTGAKRLVCYPALKLGKLMLSSGKLWASHRSFSPNILLSPFAAPHPSIGFFSQILPPLGLEPNWGPLRPVLLFCFKEKPLSFAHAPLDSLTQAPFPAHSELRGGWGTRGGAEMFACSSLGDRSGHPTPTDIHTQTPNTRPD